MLSKWFVRVLETRTCSDYRVWKDLAPFMGLGAFQNLVASSNIEEALGRIQVQFYRRLCAVGATKRTDRFVDRVLVVPEDDLRELRLRPDFQLPEDVFIVELPANDGTRMNREHPMMNTYREIYEELLPRQIVVVGVILHRSWQATAMCKVQAVSTRRDGMTKAARTIMDLFK